jgi:hypothetical protein
MLKIKCFITIAIGFLVSPTTTLAESGNSNLKSSIVGNYQAVANFAQLRTGAETDKLNALDLFGLFFSLATAFAGVVFLIQVVHGGFLWMTAGGNEEQITKARGKLVNGAIGVAIIFSAYILVVFVLTQVANITGINQGFGENL